MSKRRKRRLLLCQKLLRKMETFPRAEGNHLGKKFAQKFALKSKDIRVQTELRFEQLGRQKKLCGSFCRPAEPKVASVIHIRVSVV